MRRTAAILMIACGAGGLFRATPQGMRIEYPEDGSLFPPEMTAPAFFWRAPDGGSMAWRVEFDFQDGKGPLRANIKAARPVFGEIDSRVDLAAAAVEEFQARMADAWTWKPEASVWNEVKRRSAEQPVQVTITGFADSKRRQAAARASISIRTSRDPAGAPIFYRDVPLMPSELEKGVIKPLADSAIPLIAWRVRELGQERSRVVLEGMRTCANCHSFSGDGKTLGMDLDGPQNDKGLYAISRIQPRTTIRNEDVISWLSFKEQPAGPMRVGFMSQISPDGRYVVTTVGAERDLARNYYVANFKDFRFLQVFYATRGILVVYDRATGTRRPLPGADDPRFVQTNATWSPDGEWLVFARAAAREAYPPGVKMAEFANDPNETQVRYDLYRIPFNGGRGGEATPVEGASGNGMSNSFPRVSPDGRWIVFVQARNGLLMRPDSQLFIVPFGGGRARRLRANTPLMNSWHSFSPNGRWLVFSSKARSPYTQMYLTHLDEQGNDSPAILVENSTAANRAVNLPEFVNMAPGWLQRIEAPAVEFYNRFDEAWRLASRKRFGEAIPAWRRALELDPADARANNNLAFALAQTGRLEEAVAHWRKALEADKSYGEVHWNLGRALESLNRAEEALPHLLEAARLRPEDPAPEQRAGLVLLRSGRAEEALAHLRRAAALNPNDAEGQSGLGVALLQTGSFAEARMHLQQAVALDPRSADSRINLGNALYVIGEITAALEQWREALRLAPESVPALTQVAWALATHPSDSERNGAEAAERASRAVKLSGGRDAAALDALAAAYAEGGRFEEAAATARRALALAEANGSPLAGGIRTRLQLYERGAPYRTGRIPR